MPTPLMKKLTMCSATHFNHWGRRSLKLAEVGLRDDSMVKSTGCSSRGPRFYSQHPHGNSQVSVTPIPEDTMLFCPLCASPCTCYTDICTSTTIESMNNFEAGQGLCMTEILHSSGPGLSEGKARVEHPSHG